MRSVASRAAFSPDSQARLIVVESAPRRAPLLRRFLPSWRIWEARSFPLLYDLLHESPASLVVCGCSGNEGPALLAAIGQGVRTFPRVTWIVYGDHEIMPRQSLFYAAGAQLVLHSLAEIRLLARLAKRHFRRIPRPELSLSESIQSRLPWG